MPAHLFPTIRFRRILRIALPFKLTRQVVLVPSLLQNGNDFVVRNGIFAEVFRDFPELGVGMEGVGHQWQHLPGILHAGAIDAGKIRTVPVRLLMISHAGGFSRCGDLRYAVLPSLVDVTHDPLGYAVANRAITHDTDRPLHEEAEIRDEADMVGSVLVDQLQDAVDHFTVQRNGRVDFESNADVVLFCDGDTLFDQLGWSVVHQADSFVSEPPGEFEVPGEHLERFVAAHWAALVNLGFQELVITTGYRVILIHPAVPLVDPLIRRTGKVRHELLRDDLYAVRSHFRDLANAIFHGHGVGVDLFLVAIKGYAPFHGGFHLCGGPSWVASHHGGRACQRFQEVFACHVHISVLCWPASATSALGV